MKQKNCGGQTGLKMKQKKHNLINTKININDYEVESEDEAVEKALCVSNTTFKFKNSD